VSLAEALGQVDLESGQVYRCRVKGHGVELRVLDSVEVGPSRWDASDVMLDPWTEFPLPAPRITVVGKLGSLPPPDVPEIPRDEDVTHLPARASDGPLPARASAGATSVSLSKTPRQALR
jgi:hypothetical protein